MNPWQASDRLGRWLATAMSFFAGLNAALFVFVGSWLCLGCAVLCGAAAFVHLKAGRMRRSAQAWRTFNAGRKQWRWN